MVEQFICIYRNPEKQNPSTNPTNMKENEDFVSLNDLNETNEMGITHADLNIADRAIDEALLLFERIRDTVEENPEIEEILGISAYQEILDFMEKYGEE